MEINVLVNKPTVTKAAITVGLTSSLIKWKLFALYFDNWLIVFFYSFFQAVMSNICRIYYCQLLLLGSWTVCKEVKIIRQWHLCSAVSGYSSANIYAERDINMRISWKYATIYIYIYIQKYTSQALKRCLEVHVSVLLLCMLNTYSCVMICCYPTVDPIINCWFEKTVTQPFNSV